MDKSAGQDRGNDALGIIGEDTGIDTGQAFFEQAQQTLLHGLWEGAALLLIDADHLLTVGDDAGLGRGRLGSTSRPVRSMP